MMNVERPLRVSPKACTKGSTIVKRRVLSQVIDVVQMRIDNSDPVSWQYRHLLKQRTMLEKLALVPRIFADEERGTS